MYVPILSRQQLLHYSFLTTQVRVLELDYCVVYSMIAAVNMLLYLHVYFGQLLEQRAQEKFALTTSITNLVSSYFK